MRYLANAFSLQMISGNNISDVKIKKITKERAINLLKNKYSNVDNKLHIIFNNQDVQSTIGHEELTDFLSQELNTQVPYNRTGLSLRPDDIIVIAQITKGRLNGDTPLDYNNIAYYMVELKANWVAYFYKGNKLVKTEVFPCCTKSEGYDQLNKYILTNIKKDDYDDFDFTYICK